MSDGDFWFGQFRNMVNQVNNLLKQQKNKESIKGCFQMDENRCIVLAFCENNAVWGVNVGGETYYGRYFG